MGFRWVLDGFHMGGWASGAFQMVFRCFSHGFQVSFRWGVQFQQLNFVFSRGDPSQKMDTFEVRLFCGRLSYVGLRVGAWPLCSGYL